MTLAECYYLGSVEWVCENYGELGRDRREQKVLPCRQGWRNSFFIASAHEAYKKMLINGYLSGFLTGREFRARVTLF